MSILDLVSLIVGFLGMITTFIMLRDRVYLDGSNSKNIEDRVTSLENNNQTVAEDIKTIKENHLSHMQCDINKINISLEGINTTLVFLKDSVQELKK